LRDQACAEATFTRQAWQQLLLLLMLVLLFLHVLVVCGVFTA
jgi:hypothetical protein